MLFIDGREKNQDLIEAVINRCQEMNEPYEIRTNPVGDFVFDDKICIEHKSCEDFKSSLHNGHMDSQIADGKQFPVNALVIEGKWKYNWDPKTHSNGNFTSRHKNGKVVSYIFSETWKVPCIQVDSINEFADVLFMIRDQICDLETLQVPEIVSRHTRTANAGDDVLNLYLAFKGIALKKARALKAMYPNPADFLYAYKSDGLPQVGKDTLNKTTREALDRICSTTWAVPIPKVKKPKKSKLPLLPTSHTLS